MADWDPTTDRRLPVYLMLDCSGSMTGDPIAAIQVGMSVLVQELRDDPYALETVWLSVITFASTADQAVPLTDLNEVDVPPLEAGGSTALGEALELLEERVAAEVRRTGGGQKADWKPMVFVFTDGEPTDSWRPAAARLRAANTVNLIVCGAGPAVHDGTLRELSETFVHIQDTAPGTLGSFLKWVTASVAAASHAAGTGREVVPPADVPGAAPEGEPVTGLG